MRLKDKLALLSGSARGIGQATVELFHKKGTIVITSDIHYEDGKTLVMNLITNAEFLHLDVGNEES